MDTTQLKEYLSIAVDMEKELYTQRCTIEQIQTRISELGNPRTIRMPETAKNPGRGNWVYTILILSICLIAIEIYLISELMKPVAHIDPITHGMVFLTMLAIIIGVGKLLLSSIQIFIKKQNQYKCDKEKYEQYLAQSVLYKKGIEDEDRRIKGEMIKKDALVSSLMALQKQHEESKQTLEKIYSEEVIFPKYRNFVMVCSLYEYFCSGRCSSLEGHEGAYNILESELHANLIVAKLDEIITHLSRIEQNQYLLHSTIQASNQTSQRLVASIEDMASAIQDLNGPIDTINTSIAELQQHSALTAYQTERVQKELSYLNRMNYLTGRNNGVLYNSPPS